MECRARDLHNFFNVASQTVDVRKARKIVMKSGSVLTRHIKRISKTFAYLIMKKYWMEKIAKLLSHSILITPEKWHSSNCRKSDKNLI